ncbi:purple acid phosphatase family protein [Brockia lithotrophica]|uniref:Calcineurin-like phosphoesterase family protein n=1 Tax=Brockia lithotrophica TaxID=933949 RepID=A0A660L6X3_9BACL|nr:metallophosphoesterase family protein [Brockia lithotrophica]RKQ89075.1 calcineurin-like phosphoesterase family protein [Brockia lithotrophica]
MSQLISRRDFLRGSLGLIGASVFVQAVGVSEAFAQGETSDTAVSSENAIYHEELVTVGADRMAVTWVTEQPGSTVLWLGEHPERLTRYTFGGATRYHLAEVDRLLPATRYFYQVETDGVRGPLNTLRTLPAPRGSLLYRVGFVSDSHIATQAGEGDPNQLYLGKLLEDGPELLRSALDDLVRKGANYLVHGGDLTESGRADEYALFRNVVAPYAAALPFAAVPGNHDKYQKKTGGVGEAGFREYVSGELYRAEVQGDALFVYLDSARTNNDWGYIPQAELRWLDATLAAHREKKAFLVLHHPTNGMDVWFGTTNFLQFQNIVKRYPNVQGVFAGHMHRNYVTVGKGARGALPYVELPATVQFPNGYGLVDVYEGGIVYTSHKVSALHLSEKSREKVLRQLSDLYVLYTLGCAGDRALTFDVEQGTVVRQEGFLLTAVVELRTALGLLRDAITRRVSLTAAEAKNLVRVVFGRFATREEAERRKAELAQIVPFPLSIREENAAVRI